MYTNDFPEPSVRDVFQCPRYARRCVTLSKHRYQNASMLRSSCPPSGNATNHADDCWQGLAAPAATSPGRSGCTPTSLRRKGGILRDKLCEMAALTLGGARCPAHDVIEHTIRKAYTIATSVVQPLASKRILNTDTVHKALFTRPPAHEQGSPILRNITL